MATESERPTKELLQGIVQPSGELYRLIPLTKGQIAIVDIEDYERFCRFAWHALWNPRGKTFYASRKDSANKSHYMHREIMMAPVGVLVDHRDHNGLNNRRYNLRLASHSQNQFNHRTHAVNSSGTKGVHFVASRNKWAAYISAEGEHLFLGRYHSKREARRAYLKAAIILHGEFACSR